MEQNEYLILKKDILDEEKFMNIYNYIHADPELSEDFKGAYWETNTRAVGNIFEIKGNKRGNHYVNVEISVKDDEDLWKDHVSEEKLNKHYKRLIDLLYPVTGTK